MFKHSSITIKGLTAIFCIVRIAHAIPYQYNPPFATVTSTPSYIMKQNLNRDAPTKHNVGYKVQDGSTTKVKKEYSNSEYQGIFSPDSSKRQNYNSADFSSFDESYPTTSNPNLIPYPYSGQLKLNNVPGNLYTQPLPKMYVPATASNKIFIHHGHHDEPHPHHFVHDVVEHYITDVAGHKLKHVGEALESGELTEPIIHKLSFAKAALLQLLAIIGPLSAIKTIHVVAKASDPHHHDSNHIDGISAPAPILPAEHEEPHSHHHYPNTLVGIILHFVSQLSKFNTEAKLHLIPNLLKMVSYASSSSAHTSAHHHH